MLTLRLNRKGDTTLISEADVERVKRWKWFVGGNGYVYCTKMVTRVKYTLLLHRFILCAPAGLDVDHINGNKLDNRRENLRLATESQNLANCAGRRGRKRDTGFKGVYRWSTTENGFRASIGVRGEILHLGAFRTAESAAGAYDEAAVKHFGDFARTNKSLGLR